MPLAIVSIATLKAYAPAKTFYIIFGFSLKKVLADLTAASSMEVPSFGRALSMVDKALTLAAMSFNPEVTSSLAAAKVGIGKAARRKQ